MALIPHYCWPFYIYFGEKLIHILCPAFVRVFYHNNRNEIRTKRLVFCSVLVLLAYHPTVLWPAVSAKDFSSFIEGRWSLVVSFLDASTILFDSLVEQFGCKMSQSRPLHLFRVLCHDLGIHLASSFKVSVTSL